MGTPASPRAIPCKDRGGIWGVRGRKGRDVPPPQPPPVPEQPAGINNSEGSGSGYGRSEPRALQIPFPGRGSSAPSPFTCCCPPRAPPGKEKRGKKRGARDRAVTMGTGLAPCGHSHGVTSISATLRGGQRSSLPRGCRGKRPVPSHHCPPPPGPPTPLTWRMRHRLLARGLWGLFGGGFQRCWKRQRKRGKTRCRGTSPPGISPPPQPKGRAPLGVWGYLGTGRWCCRARTSPVLPPLSARSSRSLWDKGSRSFPTGPRDHPLRPHPLRPALGTHLPAAPAPRTRGGFPELPQTYCGWELGAPKPHRLKAGGWNRAGPGEVDLDWGKQPGPRTRGC